MSISISSSSRPSAWRAAVMGAVGVLAVGIGVAAGGFLLTSRTAAVGAGAGYVPASAPFYWELRLDPSVEQDAALRELIGHFPAIDGIDLERPLYAQLTEHIDEMLAEKTAEVSWSEDVAPWFDGRVGFAMLDFPIEAMSAPVDPMQPMDVPPMVVLLGVTDSSAASASIDRLLAEAPDPVTFTEQAHSGVTIHVAEDEGAYALTDDQLLLAPAADDIITALDAHASGDTTLSEAGESTRLTDALPSDWLAFGVFDFTEIMSASMSEAAGAPAGMAEAFESLLEHQPMRGAMAVTAAGDRLVLDAVSEPPSGPFAVENAERDLATYVPADALYYTEAGNLGSSLAAVIEPMAEAMTSVPGGEEQLGTLEAALGADIEELVSWIDDGAMAIGWDGSEPYGGLVLVPNDMDAAARRLAQLATFAELAAVDASSGVTVETSEVASVEVTTIRWEDSSGATDAMIPQPTGVAVQYALTGDRALIGVGEAFVGRALQLDGADSLASASRFTEAVAGLGGSSNAGVAWMDLTGTREAVEAALGPMLLMMDPDGAYESEVKPWLVPLDRVISVTRLEGELWIQRAALLVD